MSSTAWRARRVRPARRPRLALVLALAALTVGAAACGGQEHARPADHAATAKPGRAHANPHVRAPGARLRIVSPLRGASVGGRVRAEVAVRRFHLTARGLAKAPREGWGHLHFRLDGGRYDRRPYSGADGRLAGRLGVTGRFTPAVHPTVTYRGLPAGRHRLEVSLANNDLSDTGVHAATVFHVR